MHEMQTFSLAAEEAVTIFNSQYNFSAVPIPK